MDPTQPLHAGALELSARVPSSLSESYRLCQQIAKARAGNFYYSFFMLPKPQRLGMCALYAFMRVADDLADEIASLEDRTRALQSWQDAFSAALQKEYQHAIFPALADTIRVFSIEPAYFHTLVEGVRRDLQPQRFANWTELKRYCYEVASVVGLCCLRIWGGNGSQTESLAESAGYAFQLTNILRDVAADAQVGRVYLPEDLLREHGSSPQQVLQQCWNTEIAAVLCRLGQMARGYYQESASLQEYLPATGRAIWGVMHRTYRNLLQKMEARGFQPLYQPRTSWAEKIRLLARALPVRWGWKESV